MSLMLQGMSNGGFVEVVSEMMMSFEVVVIMGVLLWLWHEKWLSSKLKGGE